MNLKKILYVILLFPVVSTGQIKEKLELFPLTDVRLHDGPFKNAEMVDINYMLELNPDRLLAPYLREAGLTPKAESYGNWENTGLDGHIGGHYLSALSMMYASTGNSQIKKRLDYMLSELKRCQDNNANGYLAGIPGGKAMWAEIAKGNINAAAFSLNDKWVPLYNIHKVYAGLRDAYLFAGSEMAKDMLVKMADWAINLVSGLSDDQIQEMLKSEQGGLNEVFADVAGITGDKKYIKLAQQFSDKVLLEPLLNREDKLTGLHANTQIPKVIGYEKIAEIDGNQTWSDAARFFWDDVVDFRSVSIGGNSVREHFNPTDDYSTMITSEQGPETCNTYNMLRLTEMLFLTNAEEKYMDYYERALYNHILSTEDPVHGGFVYFTPMRPGHYRVYSQPQTSFWCCVGSGMENHSKYGEIIYAHSGNDIYLNLFINSELNWKENNVHLIQETKFPDEENTQLTFKSTNNKEYTLFIRYPSWIKNGEMKILVNGENQEFNTTQGNYVPIKRNWKAGDVVNVELPMHTTVEQLPDGEHYYSILHGPIVLAAKTDTSEMTGMFADDSRGGHIASGRKVPLQNMPVIESEPDKIADKIIPVSGKPLTFKINNLFSGGYNDLELVPFFKLYETRYILYFQSETKEAVEEIRERLATEEEARQKLDEMTVDMVYPGEQQPESDHFVKSENSQTGVSEEGHWRSAINGWFSYNLRDNNYTAKKLQVKFVGRTPRGLNLKILVNGHLIASITAEDYSNNESSNAFGFDIPSEVVKQSNGNLIVKFSGADGANTGRITEVRLLKE